MCCTSFNRLPCMKTKLLPLNDLNTIYPWLNNNNYMFLVTHPPQFVLAMAITKQTKNVDNISYLSISFNFIVFWNI